MHQKITVDFGFIIDSEFKLEGEFPVYFNQEAITIYGNYTNFIDSIVEENYLVRPPLNSTTWGIKPNFKMDNLNCTEHARFMVQCLSLLYGHKLTTRSNEYVGTVSLIKDYWGLNISKESMERGLIYSNKFWEQIKDDEKARKNFFSVIHLLFLSKREDILQYERFFHIYTALDTCSKVLCNIYPQQICEIKEKLIKKFCKN